MKILVVDDSIVFRSAIVSAIGTCPGLEVTRSLVNGKLAVDFIEHNADIDLITLDMEMPVLDGLATIKEIRKFNKKVVIIVFSSLTQKGAEKTLEAIAAGADDFVTKPENLGSNVEDSINSIKSELIPKIMAFKEKGSGHISVSTPNATKDINSITNLKLNFRADLVLIGSSTGGPEALAQVFKNIKNKVNVPILIVQHMPPVFTQKLAEMLSKLSPIEVFEAKNGDKLKAGVCYIAPGDYHMTITSDGVIHLNQAEKVCFVRPSVDVLFNSVADNFRGKVLPIVLTGMGEDGAVGAKKLNEKGIDIFIQDQTSSVVWGMPGSVKRQIPSSKIVELKDIGTLIESNC